MNLQNHDADTGTDQDMTPMIDVVFLLIIFFMIITDLTQQDLEEIELPVAQTSVPDEPDREVVRSVVNIDYGGLTIVKGRVRYDPESNDTTDLEGYLADQARRMPVKLLDETKPIGPRNPPLPDNPLLIRADRTSEFKYIQKVMEICGRKDIRIWKIELATSEPEDRGEKDDR